MHFFIKGYGEHLGKNSKKSKILSGKIVRFLLISYGMTHPRYPENRDLTGKASGSRGGPGERWNELKQHVNDGGA